MNDGTVADREQVFSAGAIECAYCNGALCNISVNGIEIVRRIYVAVRSEIWNTIGYTVSNLSIKKSRSSFYIEFDAHHQSGPIDFSWHAIISGTNDSEIRFTFQGNALSSFLSNRISICVLHPLSTCRGEPCTVLHVDGSSSKSRFPETISPHQPFLAMRGIAQKVKGIRYEIFFLGDVFEMEDQRNWTDASFKTYSPPLSVPRPHAIKKGMLLSQIIVVKTATKQSVRKTIVRQNRPVSFDCAKPSSSHTFPAIGCCINKGPHARIVDLANTLALSHFRIDVDAAKAMQVKAIPRFVTGPLEVAVFLSGKYIQKQVTRICKALQEKQAVVKRVIVFHKNEAVTSHTTLRQSVPVFKKEFPNAEIVTGTNDYFVEINRNPMQSKLAKNICYSINPQVHTFDDQSVMDNVFGQAATVESAKALFPNGKIFVSPITVRPRFNPKKPKKFHGPDPRQKTLFGAAWTCASIINLSMANPAGLTYFELVGDCGLMEKSGVRVFPLYHVFAYFSAFANGKIRRISSGQDRVIGCALKKNNATRLLFANLTALPQKVRIDIVPKNISLQCLDQTTVDFACKNPKVFLQEKGKEFQVQSGEIKIIILPYGIIKIDNGVDQKTPGRDVLP